MENKDQIVYVPTPLSEKPEKGGWYNWTVTTLTMGNYFWDGEQWCCQIHQLTNPDCRWLKPVPLRQLGNVGGRESLITQIWNAAITYCNNVCVQISDRYNDNDETTEADIANECAKKIRSNINEVHPDLFQWLDESAQGEQTNQ